MKDLSKKLFAPETAKWMLIIGGVFLLLLLWGYFVITSLGSNFSLDIQDGSSFSEFLLVLAFLGFIFGGYALLSVATYCNAKLWMHTYLARSFLNLLGAIPLVNHFIPDSFKHGWLDAVADMAAPDEDGIVTKYYDEYGLYYVDDGSLPLIVAIPLGIVKCLIVGSVKFLFNLVIAIGIPLLSPIPVVACLAGADALYRSCSPLYLMLGILLLAATVFLLIGQPVITAVKHKKEI